MKYDEIKYARELEDAGLHNAVNKILLKYPHLKGLAKNDAKDFANNAIHLILPDGITLREQWKLAGIAAGHLEDLP